MLMKNEVNLLKHIFHFTLSHSKLMIHCSETIIKYKSKNK